MTRSLTPILLSLTASLSLSFGAFAASTCGDKDTPCSIESGTYHALAPTDTPRGVVMMLHGGGATGKALLKSGLAKQAVERGYLFVAPNGYHPTTRFKNNWSVRATNSVFQTDDIAFLRDVMDDVATRFEAPRDNTLFAGFSRGGSMVWDIACHAPDLARAYAPVAGAFWDAFPDDCTAPVHLFHTHGWDDRTVPLEGRSLRGGSVVQGDVWQSLKLLRVVNGCDKRQPERSKIDGDRWYRYWSDCSNGSIQLMMHPGGHGVPKGWSGETLDWFESVALSHG